ncbi:NMCC_0638 family (lipo)protein [Lysobacter hankyongensis]|uniref:Uncharacterized protein n=1 Tax=Lysobacter hankyongensis TaxID=1176535 RepID=A0ABP9B9M2_9GAMM
MLQIVNLIIGISLAFSQAPLSRQEFEARHNELGEPARFFIESCIAHTVMADDLAVSLDGDKRYLRYDEKVSRPFLRGLPGMAWGRQGLDSRYAIALTESGVCTLHAQNSDRETSMKELKALIDLLYPGNDAKPVTDERAVPNNEFVASEGWAVYDARSNRTYWFTVIVPKKDGANFGAAYTVLVTR